MKVLWFCNTPGLASERFNSDGVGGGWIKSLQQKFENTEGCELGYTFYTTRHIPPFKHGNTYNFPVKRKDDNKLKRYLNRLFSKVEYDEHVKDFLQIVDRFSPDVIHIHGTENSFGLIIPHLEHIPILISIQGNLTLFTAKYFTGLDKSFVRSHSIPFFNKVLLNYKTFSQRVAIEQEILSKAKFIAGRTDWDRRITRIMAPKSTYFSVNEILRPVFYQHKWKPQKNKTPIFFTTSSDNLCKGFETIVQAALQLKRINYKFHWIVAGLTLHDEIVKLSMKREKVRDLESLGIKLLGKVHEGLLINELLNANIYVQVSHIENSPNSLCEAMLLGMPVIATHAGGTSSLVTNNESGILLQDGDAVAMAGALVEISENKSKANYMAQNAYEIAHKRHNPEKIIQDLLYAYESIIEEKKGKRIKNSFAVEKNILST